MTKCPCDKPGWCEEYGLELVGRLWELCNMQTELGERYRRLWRGESQDNPPVFMRGIEMIPPRPARKQKAPRLEREHKPGDWMHWLIWKVTDEQKSGVCGCSELITDMNQLGWAKLLNPWPWSEGAKFRGEKLYPKLRQEAKKRGHDMGDRVLFGLLAAAAKGYYRRSKP